LPSVSGFQNWSVVNLHILHIGRTTFCHVLRASVFLLLKNTFSHLHRSCSLQVFHCIIDLYRRNKILPFFLSRTGLFCKKIGAGTHRLSTFRQHFLKTLLTSSFTKFSSQYPVLIKHFWYFLYIFK